MRGGVVLGIGLALALIWSVASAQLAEVEVTVTPEGPITVGDLVDVRIAVQHEAGARVEVDGGLVQLGGMEPSAAVVTQVSETETHVVYQTRSFSVGVFSVALPDIVVVGADDSVADIAVPATAIEVESVLSDPPESRPLTAPDLLEGEARTFAPWIVAMIGIGAGFVMARLARRWVRRQAAAPPAQTADFPEAAPPSFDMDASLPAAEQCQRLASAVRARLADDWPLPASALTPAEIGPALARAGAPSVVVLRATQLLEACDRVQYGGEQPTPARLAGYAQLAAAIWSEDESAGWASHEGG